MHQKQPPAHTAVAAAAGCGCHADSSTAPSSWALLGAMAGQLRAAPSVPPASFSRGAGGWRRQLGVQGARRSTPLRLQEHLGRWRTGLAVSRGYVL